MRHLRPVYRCRALSLLATTHCKRQACSRLALWVRYQPSDHPRDHCQRQRLFQTTSTPHSASSDQNAKSTSQNEAQPPLPLQSQSQPPSTQSDTNLDPTLPSQAERRRWHLSKRFTSLMDDLQTNIFLAGKHLNDLTGYSGIETLKRSIEAQEALAQRTRAAVRAAKEAYSAAIAQRSASQREVNELLQRKHAWTAADLERFTALYRSDHANEQAEARAAETLAVAERAAEEAAADLSRSILARYHEEQIWSDKIRRMSTWGTWGLMGVNVLLFIIFQVGVEPWRRRRLVSGFEEKVREAIERERIPGMAVAAAHDEGAVPALAERDVVMEDATDEMEGNRGSGAEASQPEEPALPPLELTAPVPSSDHDPPPTSSVQACKNYVRSLFSDKQVSLRRVEVTSIALEGVAAGATLATVVCIALLRRS